MKNQAIMVQVIVLFPYTCVSIELIIRRSRVENICLYRSLLSLLLLLLLFILVKFNDTPLIH